MAQQQGISPNAFSGGAVRVNVDRFTDNYLAQVAHEDAQKEATFKYLGELGGRLTPAGMADDDVQKLMTQKNEWQAFNIANKNQLGNTMLDNGAAYMKSMQMYNSMMEHAQKSKEKTAFATKVLGPITRNPKLYNQLTAGTIDKIHRHLLPVNDPNWSPMTEADIEFKPAPLEPSHIKAIGDQLAKFKGRQVWDAPVQDKATNTQTSHANIQYANSELEGMKSIGKFLYSAGGAFAEQIDQESDPTSPEYKNHNEVFKKYTGKDIQSKEDLILAKMIELNPNPKEIQTKPEKIAYSPFMIADYNQKLRKDMARFNSGIKRGDKEWDSLTKVKGQERQTDYVNQNFDIEIRSAMYDDKGNPKQPVSIPTETGDTFSAYPVATSAAVQRAFQYTDPTTKVKSQAKVYFSKERNAYVGVVLKENENKEPVIDESLTKVIPLKDVKTIYHNERFGKEKTIGTSPSKKPENNNRLNLDLTKPNAGK